MENPIKVDDLGVKPTIFGNTHMVNLAFLEAAPPAIFPKKLVIEVRPYVKVVRRLYLGNVTQLPEGQGPPPREVRV